MVNALKINAKGKLAFFINIRFLAHEKIITIHQIIISVVFKNQTI